MLNRKGEKERESSNCRNHGAKIITYQLFDRLDNVRVDWLRNLGACFRERINSRVRSIAFAQFRSLDETKPLVVINRASLQIVNRRFHFPALFLLFLFSTGVGLFIDLLRVSTLDAAPRVSLVRGLRY